ncbi:hypothetical protein HG430_001710 [Candidatus Gracilibacteria bacterium]|nr:hypothetical protein [Candidatus Gracilibacteria bacterium]
MAEKIILESLKNDNETKIQPKYFDSGFKYGAFEEYEAQLGGPEEKVFSILLKMGNENLDEKDRFLFRNMVLAAENKNIFPELRKGEKVIFELGDTQSGTITIGKRTYKYDLVAKNIIEFENNNPFEK